MKAHVAVVVAVLINLGGLHPTGAHAGVVQNQSILELQPSLNSLSDYFSNTVVTTFTDSGYTHQSWEQSQAFGTEDDMYDLLDHIMNTSAGVLFFGGHGSGNSETEGVNLASASLVTAAITSLQTRLQNLASGDLILMQDGGRFAIGMSKAFLDDESKSREVAIIATCDGAIASDFNATARVTGPSGSCDNVNLINSIACLVGEMTTEATRTLDLAKSSCAMIMQSNWVLLVPSGGDTRFFEFCEELSPVGPPLVLVPSECPIVDDGPIADVSGFDVFDGTVAWYVEREDRTREYAIEGCYAMKGPGELLGRDDAGLGWHKLALPGRPYPFYRLVEIETSGRRLVHGVEAEEHVSGVRRHEGRSRRIPEAVDLPIFPDVKPSATSVTDPTVVIFYEDPSYLTTLQGSVAPDWTSRGHAVELVDISAYPEATRAQLVKSGIVNYNTANGTTLFHLVGDWKGDPTIPGDTSSVADQRYADLDDDGVLDVVVTRWPVENSTDLFNVWKKSWYNYVLGHYKRATPYLVLTDQLFMAGNSPQYVRDIADQLSQAVLDIDPVSWDGEIHWADYADDSARNLAVADSLNTLSRDAVVLIATSSSESTPGSFFDVDWAGGDAVPWTMSLMYTGSANVLPVVIAASCNSTRWQRMGWDTAPEPDVPDPAKRPTCDEFLFGSASMGAAAWTGPTGASLQYANYVFSYYYLKELYANPSRSMAESWLTAMQLARAAFVSSPEHLLTLDSYVLLGDPVSPFYGQLGATLTASARDATTGVLTAFPTAMAIGSPAGGEDAIVISVKLPNPQLVPDASDLRVEVVGGSSIELFCVAAADSAFKKWNYFPSSLGHEYRATVTIDEFANYGGCGIDSLAVYLDRFLLGYVEVNAKSVDIAENSYGLVNLIDMAVFGAAYNSSSADANYNWCVDYNDDAFVNLPDMSFFGAHFGDAYDCGPPASIADAAVSSAGTVHLDFTEHSPLIGQSTLTVSVSLQGVEPYTVMFLALKNENPQFTFMDWTQSSGYDGTTMVTEVIRHGQREVVLGILNDQAEGGDILLGSFDVIVMSNDGAQLTPSDFVLVTGEFLGAGQQIQQRPAYVFGNSLSASRSSTPMVFTDELAQNYPNPFNPTTTIAFSLVRRENVELAIYDVTGARVRTLINSPRYPGNHRILWNGFDQLGNGVASGIYFYRLTTSGFTATRKMVLIR